MIASDNRDAGTSNAVGGLASTIVDIPGQVASTDTHNDALKQSDSGERSQSATQSTVGEGTENKPDGLTVDMKSGKAWEIDGKLAFTTVDSSGQISSTATIIHTPNQSDRSQPFCSSNQPALGEGDGNMPDAVGTDVIENDEARNAVAELASTDTGNDTPHQSDSGERSWLSPSTYREGNGNKPDGGKASRSSSKTRWEKYENKLDGLRTSAIESDKAREVAENLASIATEITGQQAPAASDNNARRQIPSLSEEVNGGKMDGLRAAVMESDKAREIARKLRQPFSENGTSTKATPTWTTSANVLSEGTRKTVAASAVTSSATAAGRSNSAGTTDATWGKFDTDAETAAGSTAQNGRQDLPGIGWIRNVALTVNAAGKRTAEAGGDVASTVQSDTAPTADSDGGWTGGETGGSKIASTVVNTLVKRAKAARDNVALMGSDRGELTGGEAGQAGENTVAKRARVARDSVGSTVNAVGKRVGAAGGNVASTVNTVRKRAWQGVARIVRREQEQHEEQEL